MRMVILNGYYCIIKQIICFTFLRVVKVANSWTKIIINLLHSGFRLVLGVYNICLVPIIKAQQNVPETNGRENLTYFLGKHIFVHEARN